MTALPAKIRDRTFVVVPAFNEAPCIGQVISEIREQYPNVVVVDDGSHDGTGEIAAGCATYVLQHLINCGQGAALQTGIEFALERGAEYVVTFDGDGQHRVADIAEILAPIVSGEVEITLGSRFLGHAHELPFPRRMTLWGGVLFTRLMNGVKLTDAHNGLRGFSRLAASRINIKSDRMAHASELIDIVRDSGLPFREVPVHVSYTTYSLTKGQSAGDAFEILVHYLLGRIIP